MGEPIAGGGWADGANAGAGGERRDTMGVRSAEVVMVSPADGDRSGVLLLTGDGSLASSCDCDCSARRSRSFSNCCS